jgi:colanic acid biosynthesis glycosyl transferase WcaI
MRFHPDLTGTGPLVTDLATDFADKGDEVTVVTSMPHYGRRQIQSEYRGGLLKREEFHSAKVWRTFVYVPHSPKGFHRGINYLSYNFMSVVAGVLAGRHDVILCINPPITAGLSGWFFSLAHRSPVVFNVQDIWPDCLIIIDQIHNPLLIRTFQFLEKFIYRVSARVTVLSEGMQQNLIGKGVKKEKIDVIPNWADVDHITPGPKNNGFRSAHGLDGRFVVTFAGNIGYTSMLDNVLDAAKLMIDDPNVVFLIVGEGNAKAALVQRAWALGLSNTVFLPTQPKEILPEMLGAADVSLVTLNRHLGQLNVPSKTYSIMASGRPVLAAVPEDSDIADLVRKANCGMWVPPEDPSALVDAIKSLARQPEKLQFYGTNGRDYVVSHFNKQNIVQRYRELLYEVARSST